MNQKKATVFDLTFIPSFKCNLACWFCMYSGGPNHKNELSINKAKYFLRSLDLSKINAFGFYGGEISINMPLYQKFIDLTPKEIPRFTISNGSWTADSKLTWDFLHFIADNRLWVKVSATSEHKKWQNKERLEGCITLYKDLIYQKEHDDTKYHLLPMGRLANKPFSCTKKCLRMPKPYRIAMTPTGDIIFQNCDGVYQIVGTWMSSLQGIEDNIKRILNAAAKEMPCCRKEDQYKYLNLERMGGKLMIKPIVYERVIGYGGNRYRVDSRDNWQVLMFGSHGPDDPPIGLNWKWHYIPKEKVPTVVREVAK